MDEHQFTPGMGAEATSSVELSISCRNLLDKDVFSRSDPICVVYHRLFGYPNWVELKKTEVIQDCLNPDFVTKVVIDYRFEEEQPMRFEIYDIDDASGNLERADFLGYAECTLGQIVSAGYNSLTLQLWQNKQRSKQQGKITILAEELTHLKEEVTIQLEGHCMSSSSCCFAHKIFYTLSKITETGGYNVIYKSENCPGENPSWKSMTFTMNRLCNGDKDRALQFQCFREGVKGYHKDLGKYMTTFNKIMAGGTGRSGSEPVAYLTGSQANNKRARIIFRQVKVQPIHTFVDYISSGTQIHCCFAIDFTMTNGDPNESTSLHYFSNTGKVKPNPYEQAIQAVGDIIKDYDATQNFPVYGFGAKIPPYGTVSHKFPVNFNSTPFCSGVSGVLSAYRNCIRQIQLAGPTHFAPTIKDVAHTAVQNSNGRHYYVLLIITDGIIKDMSLTKEAIVNASHLPLSIVIVGVGSADFKNMEELDGDVVRLSYNGKFAQRDIVQFIPYRDAYSWLATSISSTADASVHLRDVLFSVETNSESRDTHLAKIRLAQEVLAEIPDQLTSFMKSRGIVPNRPHRKSIVK